MHPGSLFCTPRPLARPLSLGGLLLLWLIVGPLATWSQPVAFGSADDPRETLQSVWWRNETRITPYGGFSLIGAQWRTAGTLAMSYASRPFTLQLNGSVRAGIYGTHDADVNEWYDLLRLVDFVRYTPTNRAWYTRLGPLERVRLGAGLLVDFFNSNVAWDARTIGLETHLQWRYGSVAAFSDDVLMNGVVGGRVQLEPLRNLRGSRFATLSLGVNYVTDLSTRADTSQLVWGYDGKRLEGIEGDLSLIYASLGEVALRPMVSMAWLRGYGRSVGIGTQLESDNFIDLARFRLRLALFFSDNAFVPGYFGSFYQVSNARARIIDSENPEDTTERYSGVTLPSAEGGTDLLFELRLLFFQRFEFWYYFRRHYGDRSQSVSHLRLFVRGLRFEGYIGTDRGGLQGIFSTFNDLGDQTSLTFDVKYRLFGTVWLWLNSRYSYQQRPARERVQRPFLVERRFEPYVGVRLTF